MTNLLSLSRIKKSYHADEIVTRAVDEVSLAIDEGEFVAIMGPSGCGKSSLLNIIGLLDRPDGGSYHLLGSDVARASDHDRATLRRDAIGFVFQSFNLIDDLTVAENIEVALLYRQDRSDRKRRIADVLERVGMPHRAGHRPQQLSGGQQQRVAIARALVSNPRLILADEPTGNLDTANGEATMALLAETSRAGTTIVMVTHSLTHADRADRVIQLLDGRVVTETRI